jgi:hypothetical protein
MSGDVLTSWSTLTFSRYVKLKRCFKEKVLKQVRPNETFSPHVLGAVQAFGMYFAEYLARLFLTRLARIWCCE